MTSDRDHIVRTAEGRSWSNIDLCLIGFIAVVAYFPLVSSSGVTEPDSAKILWATAQALQTGEGFNIESPMYGRLKNPAYYQLFFWFYPSSLGLENLHLGMNWLNMVSIALAVVLFYWGFCHLLGRSVALMIGVLMIFCPVVWDLSGYGHPEGPAFALLAMAWACLIRAQTKAGPLAVVYAVVSVAFLVCAVLCRGEMLLAFPAFIATPLLVRGRQSSGVYSISKAALICLVAGIVYYLVISQIQDPREGVESRSFLAYITSYLSGNKLVSNVPVGFAYWAVAIGPLIAMFSLAGFILIIRRRQWRLLLFVSAWILPIGLFFLPDPGHARYFLLTVPGILCLATYMFWHMTRWQKRLAVLAVVVGSYGVNVLVYPVIVDNYTWHYRRDFGRRTSLTIPFGGMVGHREATEALVSRIRRDARRLATIEDRPVFAIGNRSVIRLAYFLTLAHPDARWSIRSVADVQIIDFKAGKKEVAFLRHRGNLKLSQTLPKLANSGKFDRFYFYEFPADEVAGDPVVLPARLRCLDLR